MTDKYSETWLAFTVDTTESEALRIYRLKYHGTPAQVTRDHTALWLGPVPQEYVHSRPVEAE